MEGATHPIPRTVEEVFNDFKGRRAGLIKALTTGMYSVQFSISRPKKKKKIFNIYMCVFVFGILFSLIVALLDVRCAFLVWKLCMHAYFLVGFRLCVCVRSTVSWPVAYWNSGVNYSDYILCWSVQMWRNFTSSATPVSFLFCSYFVGLPLSWTLTMTLISRVCILLLAA